MTNIITKMIFTGVIVTSAHTHAEEHDFKPGLWSIKSTSKIVEIDASPETEKMMRSMVEAPRGAEMECIKNIASIFELEPDEEGICKIIKMDINHNKITFEKTCNEDGEITNTAGELSFSGEIFASNISMTSSKMKLNMIGNGEYVRPCD